MILNDDHPTLADTNSSAVECLRQGKHIEAVAQLQEALATMRMAIRDAQQETTILSTENTIASETQLEIKSVPIVEDVCFSHVARCASEVCVEGLADTGSGAFRFFDRAFLLPEIGNDDPWFTANQNRVSVIILFNLALSHHSLGSRFGSSNDLELALKFYKICLSIVDECGMEEPSSPSDDFVLLLLLSLFNNIGHIQASRFDGGIAKNLIPNT